jgi:hypothetical protein
VSVSSVLNPIKDFINHEIEVRMEGSSNSSDNEDQGYLSGLTYCCNLSPPLVIVTKSVLKVFASALNATEDEIMPPPLTPFSGGSPHKDPIEEELLLEPQNHPYIVHTSVIRRLLFIRLTHGLCIGISASADVAEAVLCDKNKEVLQRIFSLLFKCLSSVWEDIGGWAQRTLHLLIGIKAIPHVTSEAYENIFPR